ncbi:MAG TPA: FHA domain-containing protein, partial [Isosphaeraceae bacterium]
MKVTLTVIEGPHQGEEFVFRDPDTFMVGRSKDAHFRLPRKDRYFSRHHLLVEVNPPECCLMDMASTNGTFVNDRKVTRIELRDGDTIRGGQTVIRVAIDVGEPDPTTLPTRVGSPAEVPQAL